MEENIRFNDCCKQEENYQIKFIWAGLSKYDEGGYEPLYIYCTVCGTIVKYIGVGGYIVQFDDTNTD